MLAIPYRFLYPSAMFFVCIGVYAANNDFFQVGEVVVIGVFGYILLRLGFHPAPILLGFVLGPRFEENFRRAMLIARGDITVFVTRPISAVFVGDVRPSDSARSFISGCAAPKIKTGAGRGAKVHRPYRRKWRRSGSRSLRPNNLRPDNLKTRARALKPRLARFCRPGRAPARAPADRKTSAHRPGVRRRAPSPRRTGDAPHLP